MNHNFINDFTVLFDIIQMKNEHGTFGENQQHMYWNGIVAGSSTPHTRFIHTTGISAVLDLETNSLRFNEGSAEKLSEILRMVQKTKTQSPHLKLNS